jgi:hypothetical protein
MRFADARSTKVSHTTVITRQLPHFCELMGWLRKREVLENDLGCGTPSFIWNAHVPSEEYFLTRGEFQVLGYLFRGAALPDNLSRQGAAYRAVSVSGVSTSDEGEQGACKACVVSIVLWLCCGKQFEV